MTLKEEKFTSLKDLYERILPALETKVAELKRQKINFISCQDIWHYCIDNKWLNKKDLRIYEMVNDILNTDVLNLEIYIKKKK